MIRKRTLPSGWYPSDQEKCLQNFEKFENYLNKKYMSELNINVNSIIVPHAGWEFSGHFSYLSFKTASKLLKKKNIEIDTIVYLGGHMRYSEKSVILNYNEIETPFGNIKVDKTIINDYKKLFDSIDEDITFSDNTVEVNLPFIKYFFPEAKIFAFYPPLQEAFSIAQFISNKIKNCLVVSSADLTHYGPNYGFTPKGTGEKAHLWVIENDKILLDALEKLDYDSIEEIVDKHQNTCSPNSIITAITYAHLKGSTKGYVLLYGSSYDIFPSASFVSYISFIA